MKGLFEGPIDDDEKVAFSKKTYRFHTRFKTRVLKPYPIQDQNDQNRYPIYDQNG